jgi:uncharacterized phage protein gp47/JayE
MTTLPCGCCTPSAGLTPHDETNRAGLSAIAYRVGTYASFRESMLEQIASTAGLSALSTREDDDYAITTIDLAAAVADVLSFYQERYANEAFLRTATQRASIGRLARLIDYSLRPGVAALAWLAFTVEAGKRFHVAKRMRVQSVPGQGELPQTFEAIAEIDADARLNRLRLLSVPYGVNPLAKGARSALVAPGQAALTAAAAFNPNDRFLLYSTGSAGVVEELTVRALEIVEERATLRWDAPVQGTWGPDTPLVKLGRRFRLYGHQAPASAMSPAVDTTVPGGIRWSLLPTHFDSGATNQLALDGKVDGLATGSVLLVDDAGGSTTQVTVTAVANAPVTVGGLTETVTVLTVSPSVPATADLRYISVYELVGAPVPLWGYAYPERVGGGTVLIPGRLREDGGVEVGRLIQRNGLQPGVELTPADIAPGKAVLVGDAATAPVPATVSAVSAVGASVLVETTALDKTTAVRVGLDAASATVLEGLFGATLPSTFALSSPHPQLRARIGDLPARTVKLAGSITTLVAAATALQTALRNAGPEPEWTQAQVYWQKGRLLVFPGGKGGGLELLPTDRDGTTVRELGLDADQAGVLEALRSAPLTMPLTYTATTPQIAVTVGTVGPRTVTLASQASLKYVAANLMSALDAADPSPGFRGAQVLVATDRLLVLPGPVGAEIAEYLRIDLALDAELDLDRETAYLLGNVVAASHGETVRAEVLGDGNAAAAFQRFALKKSPLTYVPSTKPGGVESTLQLSVGGVLWDEAPGLYGEPPTAEVYATRSADDGTTTILLGDGTTGATAPTGRSNVTATYRVGAGVAGRVGAEKLTTALDRPPGLKSVTNPLAATGGADEEAIENARENAPSTVRTFGRAVSLLDFGDLVRASGEVAKAQTVWLWDGLDRLIYLTVAGQAGGLFSDADLRRLGASLARARDGGVRLRLANYVPFPVLLRGTVEVDRRYVSKDVLAAVREAVLAALSFDAVELGEPVHLSDVYRVIQDVEGVVASDIDELQPKDPARRDRPNVDRLADRTPAPLQPHVRVLPARPDPAKAGAILPAELATVEDAARDIVLTSRGGLDS